MDEQDKLQAEAEKINTVTVGTLDIELKQFTNGENLAYAAFQKSKFYKEPSDKAQKIKAIIATIKRHPTKVRVENKIKEMNAQWEKRKYSLVPKELNEKHQQEIKDFQSGQLSGDEALGGMLARQKAEREKVLVGIISREEVKKFELAVFHVEQELNEDIEAIAESEQMYSEYQYKENLAVGELFKANRDFIYFLKVNFDPVKAGAELNASAQLAEFFGNKDKDQSYLEFLAAIDQEDTIMGVEGTPIIPWVSRITQVFIVGGMQDGTVNQGNRSERRAQQAQSKKQAKKNKKTIEEEKSKVTPFTPQIT